MSDTVVGKDRTQVLPPKAIWDRVQRVISSDWSHIGQGWTIYLNRTLPHFLGGTAWKLVVGQSQLIKMCNYMLSFGNANIYVNDYMYSRALQNSKLLTTLSGGEKPGWVVHSATAPLWKTDLARTCLTPASWLLQPLGHLLRELLITSSRTQSYPGLQPQRSQPHRKAEVRTESSSLHILEARAPITCFSCNLNYKNMVTAAFSHLQLGEEYLSVTVKQKILKI